MQAALGTVSAASVAPPTPLRILRKLAALSSTRVLCACRFFSYLHELNSAQGRPENIVEHAAAILLRLAPPSHPARLASTRFEWWAHCRPHCSGHTLHFDSDDADARRGVLTCPLLSAALYLSDESVGGPTLVTDQRYGGPLAARGWLVMPKPNRACLFDGSRLHGVVPGCGPHKLADSARRITLLFAFWERKEFGGPADTAASDRMLRSTRRHSSWQGACAPAPPVACSALWPIMLCGDSGLQPRPVASLPSDTPPVPVQPSVVPVWTVCTTGDRAEPKASPLFRECFQGF
jgi:hypothetical protein